MYEYYDEDEEENNHVGGLLDNVKTTPASTTPGTTSRPYEQPLRNDRGPLPETETNNLLVDTVPEDLKRRLFANGEGKADGVVSGADPDTFEVDPEQLAYILIGVCVGLSVLCLIVVAVTIGYKSETHYRLEDGTRTQRRIKLIKATSSESSGASTGSSSGSDAEEVNTEGQRSSPEDMAANMKLARGSPARSRHWTARRPPWSTRRRCTWITSRATEDARWARRTALK